MVIVNNEKNLQLDVETLRTEMISACDKYLHDFGLQIRAADRHSLKIQRLLSSGDKLKLFKIDEDAHALFLLVLKGKVNLMKAKTLEKLRSTFDRMSTEVNEKDKQLRSRVMKSDPFQVSQFTKDLFQQYFDMAFGSPIAEGHNSILPK